MKMPLVLVRAEAARFLRSVPAQTVRMTATLQAVTAILLSVGGAPYRPQFAHVLSAVYWGEGEH